MSDYRFSFAMAALAAIALAGCAVGPDYAPPDDGGIPEAFANRLESSPEKEDLFGYIADGEGAAPAEVGFFALGDKRLATLQSIAATNSLSILKAVKRIEASRAALAGARAEYWPNVGFSAGTSKTKSYNPDGSTERSSLRFDASWELDLFGRVRRSVEASRAELEAAGYSLEDAMLSLRAEIAAEYVNLCLKHQLWKMSEENVRLQEELFKIAEDKYRSGLGSELDWQTAAAQWHSALAAIPAAQSEFSDCVRRLELLCSLPPCAMSQFSEMSRLEMPEKPVFPNDGNGDDDCGNFAVRSDAMRNRPDVRRAEREYATALARIGVAKASYFPSVSIGAGFSLASDAFADWGDAMRSIDFGPSLSWNLLSFGRTRAKVAQARANAEESALAYREAVLNAYHEIEDALEADDYDGMRENMLGVAARDHLEAEKMARKAYEEGLGEYRDLLSASQSRLSAERSLAEVRARRILDRIALRKALGSE